MVEVPQRAVDAIARLHSLLLDTFAQASRINQACCHVPAEAKADDLGEREDIELVLGHASRIVRVDQRFEGPVGAREDGSHGMEGAEHGVSLQNVRRERFDGCDEE
ncbi:hypothetical protein GCM10009796_23080 [Microbacterium koreense]